ncbi:MAG: hypothetical protein ABI551_00930 [Polyangiaceae bacterium]
MILKPGFDPATAPAGMTIVLDGLSFTLGALNSPVPIDPGEHALSVTAPEKKAFEKKFTSAAGTGTDTIEIPALEDAPKAAPSPIYSTPEDHSVHWNKTKLTVGIILGVVGLGGVGTAVGLGLNASSLNQKSITLRGQADNCTTSSTPCPDDNGNNITDPATRAKAAESHRQFSTQNHDAASTSQTIAIVSGIAGGLCLIGGAFFIITAPESKKATPPADLEHPTKLSNLQLTPVVGPQYNGLGLSGSF